MKRLWVLLAFGVLLPATARAESIAISLQSTSGGFTGGSTAVNTHAIDLGTIVVTSRRNAKALGRYSFNATRRRRE